MHIGIIVVVALVVATAALVVWSVRLARRREERRRQEVIELEELRRQADLRIDETRSKEGTHKRKPDACSDTQPWDMQRLKSPDVFHPLFDPVAAEIIGQMAVDRLYLRWVEGQGFARRACFFLVPSAKFYPILRQAATYAISWCGFLCEGHPIERLICEPLCRSVLGIVQTRGTLPERLPDIAAVHGHFDPTDPDTLSLLEDLLRYPNYVFVCSAPKTGETALWDDVPAKEQVQVLASQIHDPSVSRAKRTDGFASLVADFTRGQPVVPLSVQLLEQQSRRVPESWLKELALVRCKRCGSLATEPRLQPGPIYLTAEKNVQLLSRCPGCHEVVARLSM